MSPAPAAAASAKKVLQSRALQCSFTSVFHIQKTATNAQAFREAKNVEDIFVKAVGLPMFAMGMVGAGAWVWKEFN
eukprot:CAMPEP_0203646412 /NCGR_PEP_ID=MMETSP0088-20131115/12994_1 /ASSEMBLY_ACC=CAM_ASM_001087 /TAXON_ID=426623 /ORGANISM="Chaetoceros affinis, Strain CCMP159" /LENGTH=75 /DNA_ID=CAMNT_0050503623 /DNA_START=8 /DNA_END=235 /DNA_ORIENTATION=-